MKKVRYEKRGAAILLFNVMFTITLLATMVAIIPGSFWTTEVFPAEIWVLLALTLTLSVCGMLKTQENYPALVAGFIAVSIASLVISNVAPSIAEELHIVANYKVRPSTYVVLAAMLLGSIYAWRFVKRKWSGQNNPDLSRFFDK